MFWPATFGVFHILDAEKAPAHRGRRPPHAAWPAALAECLSRTFYELHLF